jgi:DNA-binding IclR family transcriptional regulator
MQSLDRFIAILRVMSAAEGRRLRLTEIAQTVGLSKATTLRLLTALRTEGLVDLKEEEKTFALGPQLVFLGLVASRHFQLNRIARPVLEQLAEATGDTAYLTLRDGAYSVCVDRVLGSYPVQTLSIDVGTRRPLGCGAGPVAVLATLPKQEADELIRRNAPRLAKFPGLTAERVRREVAEARVNGYAYTEGHVVQHVNAVAVAIKDAIGNPVGAVTLAAIASRFADGRLEEVAAAVTNAVRSVERALPRPTLSKPGARVRLASLTARDRR